jgi:hypothetical protein
MSTLISRNRSHQHLIEARLDAIERYLMDNRVSRSERNEIVSAVEEQISELLETEEGEITREKVLLVLASLDPPEAYCGDEPNDRPVQQRRSASGDGSTELPGQRRREQRLAPLAILALVFSLLSIPTIMILPLGSLLALAGGICGVIAVSQVTASHGRLNGLWMAIVGCAMFVFYFAGIWAILLLQ